MLKVVAMKIIIQAGILMLFILIANAKDFCSTYVYQPCSTTGSELNAT